MKKFLNKKNIFIILYIIFLIYIGYISVEKNTNILTQNIKREEISWLYLFFFNYSNVIFLIIIAFLGGIFSIFAISSLLIKTGVSLHIIYLNTNISLLNLISITMIHGILELWAVGIALGVAIDIFIIFFKTLILDFNIELKSNIKTYLKTKISNKIILISILLFISSILEFFVSAKIFSILGIK
ncbi:hypothetical protein ACV3P1_16500 [Clostridium perfringens]